MLFYLCFLSVFVSSPPAVRHAINQEKRDPLYGVSHHPKNFLGKWVRDSFSVWFSVYPFYN